MASGTIETTHLGVVLITTMLLMLTTTTSFVTSQTQQDFNQQQGAEPEPEFQGSIANVTYPAGREALLTCTVKNLGRYKVGWLRASDQTVLALQGRVVTHNARISVTHEDFHTWRLRIKQLRESDRGCYMCQINSSPMQKQIGCIDVQVPPDIINEESSADIAVQEGEDAVLACRATGNPTPRVLWRREDGEVILLRKPGSRNVSKVETFNGTYLRLFRLERRQMGAYLCIASNDVPPAVSKRVSLSVHFAPSVRAPSQLLGAPLGSDVQLNCQVEASPAPVTYWLKGGRMPANSFAGSTSGGHGGNNGGGGGGGGGGNGGGGGLEMAHPRPEMLLDGPKYGITEQRNGYKGIMRLTVRSFSSSDVGTYHCVSTNSLGRAEGTLRLYEIKIHPGISSADNDQVNIIGSLAEAARGRGNSGANSPQLCGTTKTTVMLLLLMTTLSGSFINVLNGVVAGLLGDGGISAGR